MFSRLNTGTAWVDRPCQPADIAKPDVEEGVSDANGEIFRLQLPCLARPIFSMPKIAILNAEAKTLRVSERNFFPYRPESSSDECQHADIAERCFDEGLEKYSALYFCLVGDDGK